LFAVQPIFRDGLEGLDALVTAEVLPFWCAPHLLWPRAAIW
jgi:hypothetical protein